MQVRNVPSSEYAGAGLYFLSPFHTAEFAALHQDRFDDILHLLFEDNRVRFGMIVGVKDGACSNPVSAPFGGFAFAQRACTISQFDTAIAFLKDYLKDNGCSGLRVILPPQFYEEKYCAYSFSALLNQGFELSYSDINYHFTLDKVTEYEQYLWRNARKNLNKSLQVDTTFFLATTMQEKQEVYDIISINRMRRGFPLRMSFEQIQANSSFIDIDYLGLRMDERLVAGAVVYRLNAQKAMVVYWGDDTEHAQHKVMNLLAKRVFEFYQEAGFLHLDIGPSSEGGVPSQGLCDFKDSIGCDVSLKHTLHIEL